MRKLVPKYLSAVELTVLPELEIVHCGRLAKDASEIVVGGRLGTEIEKELMKAEESSGRSSAFSVASCTSTST